MPSKRDVLALLTRDELLVIVDQYELCPPDRRAKNGLVETVASSKKATLTEVLPELSRDRLYGCRRRRRRRGEAHRVPAVCHAGGGPPVPLSLPRARAGADPDSGSDADSDADSDSGADSDAATDSDSGSDPASVADPVADSGPDPDCAIPPLARLDQAHNSTETLAARRRCRGTLAREGWGGDHEPQNVTQP